MPKVCLHPAGDPPSDYQLLPQRNASQAGDLKLQLLRVPVAAASSYEELFMEITNHVRSIQAF